MTRISRQNIHFSTNHFRLSLRRGEGAARWRPPLHSPRAFLLMTGRAFLSIFRGPDSLPPPPFAIVSDVITGSPLHSYPRQQRDTAHILCGLPTQFSRPSPLPACEAHAIGMFIWEKTSLPGAVILKPKRKSRKLNASGFGDQMKIPTTAQDCCQAGKNDSWHRAALQHAPAPCQTSSTLHTASSRC